MKFLSAVASLILLTSVNINAAEWVVTSSGSGSSCTESDPCGSIQTAVNLAAPGDEVHLGPGTFTENVKILPGKNGVSIVGSGSQTIVQSSGGIGGVCAPCQPLFVEADIVFDIFSPDVVIRNLAIVHPGAIAPSKRDLGVFVRPPATNVSIKNINFRRDHIGETGVGPGSRGVFVFLATGTAIMENNFRGTYQDAIHIPTSGATVSRNNIANAPRIGIVIIQEPGGSPAVDSLVKYNVVDNSGDDGIQIQGDSNIIMKNTVTNNGGAGIKLCGAQIGDCVQPGDSAILAVAEGNFVKSNKLSSNAAGAIVDNGTGNTVK